MANMQERLESAVLKAENNSVKFHEIINGNDELSVETDNGLVPSVAKKLKEIRTEITTGVNDVVTETKNYRDESLNIKNSTQTLLDNATNEANRAKSEADKAEGYVNQINPDNIVNKSLSNLNSDGLSLIKNTASIFDISQNGSKVIGADGHIVLENHISIYSHELISDMTFDFDFTQITQRTSQNIITFEVMINVDELHSIILPDNILWIGGEAPDMSELGLYLLAFRKFGDKILGNLQGRF